MKTPSQMTQTQVLRVCMWLAISLQRKRLGKVNRDLLGLPKIMQRHIGVWENIRQTSVSHISLSYPARIDRLADIPENDLLRMIYATNPNIRGRGEAGLGTLGVQRP